MASATLEARSIWPRSERARRAAEPGRPAAAAVRAERRADPPLGRRSLIRWSQTHVRSDTTQDGSPPLAPDRRPRRRPRPPPRVCDAGARGGRPPRAGARPARQRLGAVGRRGSRGEGLHAHAARDYLSRASHLHIINIIVTMALALRTAARVLPVKQVSLSFCRVFRLCLCPGAHLRRSSHAPAAPLVQSQSQQQARCIVPVGRVARPAVFTRGVAAAKAPESTAYANEEKASRGGGATTTEHQRAPARAP